MAGWNSACPDWEQRLRDGRSLVPDLPLFTDEADKAVRIFNRLRLPDVIGQPTFAEAMPDDWFRDIVRALFGSYDVETQTRHIQEVFCLVPKKNGKSTNSAGVMVTAAIMNRRPNAEALFVAPTKDVADIAFRQAEGMIRADVELTKLFHLQRHIRTIRHRRSDMLIQIKAADTDAITGVKATYILIDETHVFAEKARAADVFLELRGALAARPDGFLFQISTQSKSPPAGVFKAELQAAREVRDGKSALPLLPVLYEFPKDMEEAGKWRNEEHFPLVNPNLGRAVRSDFLVREMKKASDRGREALALFASQHLNVEIGLGLKSDRWVGADHWEKAGIKGGLSLEQLIERCEVACVGIDGGGLDDMLGLAVIGRDRETREWLHWGHAWVHEGVLALRQEIAPRLRDFSEEGSLTIVGDGSADDIEQVADLVEQLHVAGILPEKRAIGVDPSGISEIIDALELKGLETGAETGSGRVVGIRQGAISLNPTIKTAERRLASKELRHGGTTMMAWVVGNAKVEARGNAILITKQTAGTAKIDPLMALFNAVALMAMSPEPPRAPEYQLMIV